MRTDLLLKLKLCAHFVILATAAAPQDAPTDAQTGYLGVQCEASPLRKSTSVYNTYIHIDYFLINEQTCIQV